MIFEALYSLIPHYIDFRIIFNHLEERALCLPLTYIEVRRIKILTNVVMYVSTINNVDIILKSQQNHQMVYFLDKSNL